MKTQPIRPACIDFGDPAAPFAPDFADIYHPRTGALSQARHVFLQGNGLPDRWRGCDRFVVLETGFGLGNNFLATWDAWRRDAAACRQLHVVSIERHPPRGDDLRRVPRDPSVAPLAAELADAWPPLVAGLHRLAFDAGRVQLLLAFGDVADWLPEIVARVDAFYLDGFAPAKNPQMWQPRLFKAMARLAADGATAATWTAARVVRDGLAAAGFVVESAAGQGGKRDITLARWSPSFVPRGTARGVPPPRAARSALIVGGGLAGCASAWALAQHGWRSSVLERHPAPAGEASGNPAGIFHGVVHADDGVHARFHRAAALEAQRCIASAIARHGIAGAVDGLLRLETSGGDVAEMQATLDRAGLPHDYVRALDARAAGERAGVALQHPAWFYPGGGWVRPAELAVSLLRDAGELASWRGGVEVAALRRDGQQWQALDARGDVLAVADVVVLANAADAVRLSGIEWPVQRVRGQISRIDAAALPAVPRLPVAGAGYVVPPVDGELVFGATSQPGDDDPTVRDADDHRNVAQLSRLLGIPVEPAPARLQGRTAWRVVSGDRLPLVGGVPDMAAAMRPGVRLDQPRFVPRQPGLFVLTALGSRGIGVCALAAQVVASAVSGAPAPMEASLLDAVDPARFVSRAARRA
jgi:tRNA 5-methylaminomethyl-2-thiouridine biosynthesis bifunctional protein